MQQERTKNIDPKYIDMVARFQAIPNDKKHFIKRFKLMYLKFEPWFRRNRDQLTEDEREYLQANIWRVEAEDEAVNENSDIKEWWED